MRLGLQLYSLRKQIAELGLDNILHEISKLGYKGVEFAGFYNKSPQEIKALLDKYKISPIGVHVGLPELLSDWDNIHEYANVLGFNKIIIAWIGGEAFNNDYDGIIRDVRKAVTMVNNSGMQLGYHNHAHEFNDGADYISKLLGDVPELCFEPDVFWLKVAGNNPVEYMQNLADRIFLVHIKELSQEGVKAYNPIPCDGVANIKEVIKMSVINNVSWGILEVENLGIPYHDYLEKSSYNILKCIKDAEEKNAKA